MESITSIATAVSTGTVALIAILTLTYQGVSRLLRWREKRRFESCRESRIEVLNVEVTHNIVTILVRNRSHIPTVLFQPEFKIRDSGPFNGYSTPHRTDLGANQFQRFMVEVSECLSDLSPSECVMIHTGEEYGA